MYYFLGLAGLADALSEERRAYQLAENPNRLVICKLSIVLLQLLLNLFNQSLDVLRS